MLFSVIVDCRVRKSGREGDIMKYRSNLDIFYNILQAANESGGGSDGTTQTKIMYKAFLSYMQMKGYLQTLTQNDFLSYDESTQTFKTTEKGRRFLDTYKWISDAIKGGQQQQQLSRQRQQVHAQTGHLRKERKKLRK